LPSSLYYINFQMQSNSGKGGRVRNDYPVTKQRQGEMYQAPSNNQSGNYITKGGPEERDDQFDFLLSNEPNQFNCFMNSIIQAMWHCGTIKEAIQ
jgi:hypothetical protein